jgi:hypothetical protein
MHPLVLLVGKSEAEVATHTAIIVAIVAFVSTILGASIGAFTTYSLAVRRERADRDKDNRAHATEVKRAARLIDVELTNAQTLAEIAIKKKYWNVDAELPIEAWQKYGGTIAPDLSNQAWLAVMLAFQALKDIKGTRALYLGGVLRDVPLSDKSIEGIDVMQRDVTLGREALAPFAYWDQVPARMGK